MAVVVPLGAAGGMLLQVQTPDSGMVQVQVPDGLTPGQTFLMELPPTAVHAAVPAAAVAPVPQTVIINNYMMNTTTVLNQTDGAAATAGVAAAVKEPDAIPTRFVVSGAGIPQANGTYVRDGTYAGCALFKKRQLWLLRYQMPSGGNYWYIADKDLLDRNDGDLYRVKSDGDCPPHFGWGVAQDGVAPAPTLEGFSSEADLPVPAAVAHAVTSQSAVNASGWALAIGDCMEVRDTHGLWAVARVVGTLFHGSFGPLLLVHFEGWSNAWCMWLHHHHDGHRVRPLSSRRPGIGSRGAHTEASFAQILADVRHRLTDDNPSTWPRTGGRERTLPFASRRTMTVALRDVEAWLGSQPPLRQPFTPCEDLSADRALCERVAQAVRTGPSFGEGAIPDCP
jgi:hypothetical protein